MFLQQTVIWDMRQKKKQVNHAATFGDHAVVFFGKPLFPRTKNELSDD